MKRITFQQFIIFHAALSFYIISIFAESTTTHASYTLYVALQSTGILTLSFNPKVSSNESLHIADIASNAGKKPGWLTIHGDCMYSASRTAYPTNATHEGGLFSFQIERNQSLSYISSTSSNGEGGVHCDVNPAGTILTAANIDGSTVSIHPLSPNCTIGGPSQVFHYTLSQPGPGTNDSQEISNPHQAVFDPTGQYIFVPDRGADLVYIYYAPNPWSVTKIRTMKLLLGTGPRHIVFRIIKKETYMFLVSELDNTLRVYLVKGLEKHQPNDLKIAHLQTLSTLGPGSNRTEPINHNLAAEVMISNDNRFVYVSNRNTQTYDSDTIAIYSIGSRINLKGAPWGHLVNLTYIGASKTQGKIPRHFSLSPDPENKYVAVPNQASQSLFIFERDVDTGFLGKVKGSASFGDIKDGLEDGPVAIQWGAV